MLKFLSGLKRANNQATVDAERLYRKTMAQSRLKGFYSEGLSSDDYDGRMEVLCLHLSLTLYTLRRFGDNGARLSQALYDVMIKDFDTALREEGLSDAGVKRRMKPLVGLFFQRAKDYADALEGSDNALKTLETTVLQAMVKAENIGKGNTNLLGAYVMQLYEVLASTSLGDIAQGKFDYPKSP